VNPKVKFQIAKPACKEIGVYFCKEIQDLDLVYYYGNQNKTRERKKQHGALGFSESQHHCQKKPFL